jgi:hypothetical protein
MESLFHNLREEVNERMQTPLRLKKENKIESRGKKEKIHRRSNYSSDEFTILDDGYCRPKKISSKKESKSFETRLREKKHSKTHKQIISSSSDADSSDDDKRSFKKREKKKKKHSKYHKQISSSSSDADSSDDERKSSKKKDKNKKMRSSSSSDDSDGYQPNKYRGKIPNFTYSGNEDWLTFKKKFTLFAKTNKWGNDECLYHLCFRLTGKAAEFYTAISEDDDLSYRALMKNWIIALD